MATRSTSAGRPWAAIALAAVTAVVAGTLLVVLRGRAPQDGIEPEQRASPATGLAAPLELERVVQPAPAAAPNTEEFLAAYWGDQWPRMEAELRKQEGWADFDLSKLPMPPPLEEALPILRAKLSVMDPKTRASVRKPYLGFGELEDQQWIQRTFAPAKPLGDAEFAAIAAHAGPAQRALEGSADRILDSILETRMRLFDQGERVVAPFTMAGATNTRDWKTGLLESHGVGWEGWGAGVMVLQSDVPGWDEMYAENRRLIEERNQAIREFVQGL